MDVRDDDLSLFEAHGAAPLPPAAIEGHVTQDGARIRYAAYGAGKPVILLHGGLGHSGNWGYQVPALVEAGYRAVTIDSRGHGRSSRDARPYTYQLMAGDVLAVMDALGIEAAPFVGWSDGACTALILAHTHPGRVDGVFFFACNMDPGGAKEIVFGPVLKRCFARHMKDYQALSPTPDDFEAFSAAVGAMQAAEPNYTAQDLGEIAVPVAIVQGEGDEFIRREHAEYLAGSIPGATLTILPEVSHFAPLQRPALFNASVLAFLGRLPASGAATAIAR